MPTRAGYGGKHSKEAWTCQFIYYFPTAFRQTWNSTEDAGMIQVKQAHVTIMDAEAFSRSWKER